MENKPARIIIFSGGTINEDALQWIQPDDLLIGADRGAAFLVEHQIHMHIAVGDFDSVSAQMKEQIQLYAQQFIDCDPIYKDLTDTEMAFEIALTYAPKEIWMFGVIGSRLDHSLANIHLLRRTLQLNIQCIIMDSHNLISIMGPNMPYTVSAKGYTYVSLLPLTLTVTGVTLEGFQYPLNDATLTLGKTLSVSNQLAQETGVIRISEGLLLIIQSKD